MSVSSTHASECGTLIESIDMDALKCIVENFDYFYTKGLLGRFVSAKHGYSPITDKKQAFKLVNDFYNNKKETDEVKYRHARSNPFGGRLFSTKTSLQGMSRRIRHTISRDIYYDIDIVNAHPIFALHYAKMNGLDLSALEYYINNRERCLSELMSLTGFDRDTCKAGVLAVLNGGNRYKWFSDNMGLIPSWFYQFHNQISLLFFHYINSTEGKKRYDFKLKQKEKGSDEVYNVNGSAFNLWLCEKENEVLGFIIDRLKQFDLRVGVLCFDGAMIYKDGYSEDEINSLLPDICEYVESKTGICIQLKVKEMNEWFPLEIPKDSIIDNNQSLTVVMNKSLVEASGLQVVSHGVDGWVNVPLSRNTFIRASHGRGKTTWILDIIKQYNPTRCLFVAPTIALTNEILSKVEEIGFSHYSNRTRGDLKEINRLVITPNSLFKLDKAQKYDIVIFDEWCSISDLLTGGIDGEYIHDCNRVFRWLVKYSGCKIVTDADLTIDICAPFFSTFPKEELDGKAGSIFHQYESLNHLHYRAYLNKAEWTYKLLERLEQGCRIAVPTWSPKNAQYIKEIAERELGKKCLLLSADYGIEEKYDLVKDWSLLRNYDLFIYTPSIQVGCSIDEKDLFDWIMPFHHHVTGMSPQQFLQLCRRVRHPKNHYIDMFIHKPCEEGPLKEWSSDQLLESSKSSLQTIDKYHGNIISDSEDWKLEFVQDETYMIYLNKMKERHINKNGFLFVLRSIILSHGAKYSLIEPEKVNIERLVDIVSKLKDAKKIVIEKNRELWVKAKDLEAWEAQDLALKRQIGDRITEGEVMSLTKWFHCSTFGVDSQLVDESFYDKYIEDKEVIKTFRRIKKCYSSGIVNLCTAKIYQSGVRENALGSNDWSVRLNREVIWDMVVFGYEVKDFVEKISPIISKKTMLVKLDSEIGKWYNKNEKILIDLLEQPKIDWKTYHAPKKMLFINKILGWIGYKLDVGKKRDESWSLEFNDLFKIDNETRSIVISEIEKYGVKQREFESVMRAG